MERTTQLKLLESELAVVKSQNDRLNDENTLLRDKLNRLTTSHRSTAAVNVEAKIKAFQMEDERDQLWQHLENLKRKYNQLHEAYIEKVKKCKILESTFQRQKTLTGLVMKSAIKQRNEEQKRLEERENVESLQPKIQKLQDELNEAYDIIDELEFELETIDLLEIENKRLHKELSEWKIKYEELKNSNSTSRIAAHEQPPAYSEVDGATSYAGDHQHRHVESICETCADDHNFDSDAVDRAVLTQSFLKSAEAESNVLRRQLLKCRLQNKNRTSLGQQQEEFY